MCPRAHMEAKRTIHRSQLSLPPWGSQRLTFVASAFTTTKFPNSYEMVKPATPVRRGTGDVHSFPGCLCEAVKTAWAFRSMKQLPDHRRPHHSLSM